MSDVRWPPWSLLGGATYTPSHATNLAEKFRKLREQQERRNVSANAGKQRTEMSRDDIFIIGSRIVFVVLVLALIGLAVGFDVAVW